MPSHSRIANLALASIATLSTVASAYQDDQVWTALSILKAFARYNAEPFCEGFIHYEPPKETCWVTDAAVTVTKTTPCGEYPVTPAPKPTGYETSIPGVITVLTTTTITYTTTSTIYVPAATGYPTEYKRDTYCPDYDVPCRLVQYDDDVIAAACEKYLGEGGVTVTITEHVHAPTATVTAKDCGVPAYEAKPVEYGYEPAPAPGGYPGEAEYYEAEHHEAEYHGAEHEYHDDDGHSYYDDAYAGDGEDTPSGVYNYAVGDGEDVPAGVYDSGAGDGVDASHMYGPDAYENVYDYSVGDGEDVPDIGVVGDGEGLPKPFYIDGSPEEEQDDGTGYSPYDK
ncbi:hypothetical protein J1614_010256 [Plenodomus biglobosus]|nr:hypothetical protein J1614_010256 [Plenodomus biglobosus]